MKKVGVTVLVLALAVSLAVAAAPQARGARGFGGGEMGMGMDPQRLGFLAKHLDLTDQQKADIKKILDAEKSVMEPVATQLRENRQALKEATDNGQFNEAAVTSLADKQGDLMAQMIVSRHRVQSQIWQVLTPEQREKAEQLKQQAGQRRGGGRMGRRGPAEAPQQ